MRFLSALCLCLAGLAAPLKADQPRMIAGLGQQFDTDAPELALRYLGEPFFRSFQPSFGVSLADNGSAWVGAGVGWTWTPGATGVFLRLSSMAGVYRRGSGKDLGGPVQFRSALDLGLRRDNGSEIGLGLDHRSNANIYTSNPGLDTAYLFFSIPLR